MIRLVPWFFGVFALAIYLHTFWGFMLLFSSDPMSTTPLHTLSELVGLIIGPELRPFAMSVVLFTTSALAGWSLVRNVRGRGGIALVIPQQCLTVISGGGAAIRVIESAYADGVIRPQGFIGADQMLVILLAVVHTMAIFWVILVEMQHRG